MITHVSIDLETLDTCSRATILSIGAVAVGENGQSLAPDFYRVCNTESQTGRTLSRSTVGWWENQSDEARKIFDEAKTANHLIAALKEFRSWILQLPGEVQVWGNGATFDVGIIADAMWELQIKEPWDFWNIRDLRTLADLAYRYGFKNPPERVGTHHNAIDDARHQSNLMVAYFRHLDEAMSNEG